MAENTADIISPPVFGSSTHDETEAVVGFEDEVVKVMDLLTRKGIKSEHLKIISIVGMPGLGKTTLARQVYSHSYIEQHFYVRAWITISQVYKKRNLLLDILNSPHVQPPSDKKSDPQPSKDIDEKSDLQIQPSKDIDERSDMQPSKDINEKSDQQPSKDVDEKSDPHIQTSKVIYEMMSDSELSNELHKRLKSQRYLIVMDDIWTTDAWNDLQNMFPDDMVGSRIMFTSRNRDVAMHAKAGSIIHDLRLLSKEESWVLLQKKVFREKICPPELVDVGKKIVERYQRLPLSIVVIGGVLAKTEKTKNWWTQVAERRESSIFSDTTQYLETLELSYNHLPNHLKPLFLYFGVFPEDSEILVSKLIWLWIAEGFIVPTGDTNLEDEAEDYLMGLIERNLIEITKRRSKGGVKSCRIHDLLRDLSLKKAEEENFMQKINGCEKVSSTFYSSPSSSPFSNKLLHRMCIHSDFFPNFSFESCPNLSSLFCYDHKCADWMSSISINFKFLRVLNLEHSVLNSFPSETEALVHLRYLALRAEFRVIPPSISNLQNLETLIVRGRGSIVLYGDQLCRMTKLRHLLVTPSVFFRLNHNLLLPPHLQTISTSYFDRFNIFSLKSTPSLRKLKCIIYDNEFNPGFHGLVYRLETLNMHYNGKSREIYLFDLSASLKKLTLSEFHFKWRVISEIARLPNLEVLKLLDNAFDGDWLEDTCCTESNLQMFPELKFLKFESLNIKRWEVSKDYFPNLQRLVLNECWYLDAIPSDIGDILTLKTIELTWSSNSAADSAREILKEQQEQGNQLEILIHNPRFGE